MGECSCSRGLSFEVLRRDGTCEGARPLVFVYCSVVAVSFFVRGSGCEAVMAGDTCVGSIDTSRIIALIIALVYCPHYTVASLWLQSRTRDLRAADLSVRRREASLYEIQWETIFR